MNPQDVIAAPEMETTSLAATLISAYEGAWAISPRGLQGLVRTCSHPDFEAVAARIGKPVADGRNEAQNRNGTAIINVRGPLFRYRSIFTWLLGGTSVDQIAQALQAAVDDPQVRNIVMAVNSPGGQIDGINELAKMIRASGKPVTAYVDGLAASGAYWLAAAAGRIVADETAQLGSIGVLATIVDDRASEERHGIKRFEIVSSQSPLKRTDPATEEGRAQIQAMVDKLASIFIAKIADFRGVTEQQVEQGFGRGATLPAAEAIGAGMADGLGTLESLLGISDQPLRDIRDQPQLRVITATATTVQLDEDELEEDTEEATLNADPTAPNAPDDDQEDESEGTEQEPDDSSVPHGGGDLIKPNEDRQRIAAILTCEEARGRDELARVLALDTDHTLEVAQKILKASPAPQAVNALGARMAEIGNPVVGVGTTQQDDSPQAEAARILSFVPKGRLRRQPVQ
jgi:ClpP class serine protease